MERDQVLRDLLAFITYAQEKKVLSNAQILFNVSHDLAGIVNKDKCFSPRTEGYWEKYWNEKRQKV